ncbi:MAG TPA: DNA-3-methyladenine glycosylase [Bellilinea sp.]|nr:DNA-3-methyladenine glycosylase [Bellilinea sp.]
MEKRAILPRDWYARDVITVSKELLGQILVRRIDGRILRCKITETEAYDGDKDLACHARAGRTPRTAILYGEPGIAYIYFVYGIHWCLNVVCHPLDDPAASLIRAVQPLGDEDWFAQTRPGIPTAHRTDGPAKLTAALKITGALNGTDFTDPGGELWIEQGKKESKADILASPRVGIDYVPEPWKSMPWRFRLRK